VIDAAGNARLIDEAAQIWAEATAARDPGCGGAPAWGCAPGHRGHLGCLRAGIPADRTLGW